MTRNADAAATIRLMEATKAIAERDIRLGIVTEEQMRLTIMARQKEVARLANTGMSTRQISKAVGSSQTQVRRDMSRNGSKSEPKRLTKRPIKIEAELISDDDPGDDAQTIWRRGLVARSCGAIASAQHEDWSEFKTDDELVATVQQAADAWKKLAAYMRRIHNADKC